MSRSVIAVALILVAAALPAARSETDPSSAEREPFQRTGHYRLVIDGVPDPDARLYLARGVPRLVISSDKLASSWLVTAGKRVARALSASALEASADDPDLVLVATKQLEGANAPVTLSGRALIFGAEKHRLKIEPPPALLGEFAAADLAKKLPEFRRLMAAYSPRAGNVRLLREWSSPVELLVFLGSWCPHCEKLVPRLASTLEAVGNNKLNVRYLLVPRRISDDPLARQYRVEAVPTIVLLEGGKEKLRLEGADLSHPEETLARVLFGS